MGAEIQVLQTFLVPPMAPMLSMSDSSIFEGSCIPVSWNKKLNALKTAESLNARVIQAHISSSSRKERKGREKLSVPDAKSTHSNMVRYEVFYAKQFSRRRCGARKHGDTLLISE